MTDYDFIDADRPERKREVQRRIEAKGEDGEDTAVTTDKVGGGDNSGIVNKVKNYISNLRFLS